MNRLNTIDGETLMTTPVPAIRFVVDQLLPQGLHILAGAPKVGKSWLALWLCLCVSKGENVWGFATAQCSVLYLCLEDSYARTATCWTTARSTTRSALPMACTCWSSRNTEKRKSA